MSKRSPTLFLRDTAIEKIEKYTAGVDFKTFSENPMMIDAVVLNIAIIGEAAKRIPEDFKSRFPDIPWREMAGKISSILKEVRR